MKKTSIIKSIIFIICSLTSKLFLAQNNSIIYDVKVIKGDCNSNSGTVVIFRKASCQLTIWTTKNGVTSTYLSKYFSSTSGVDTLKNIPLGNYIFLSSNNYYNDNDEVKVERFENLKINSSQKNNLVCEGKNTLLSVPFAKKYSWSTGDTTYSINADKAGKYWVTITDPIEKTCTLTDTIELTLNPKLTVDVLQQRTDCEKDCSTNVKYIPHGGNGPYETSFWPDRVCFEGCEEKADSVQNQCYASNGWIVYVKDSKGCYLEKKYNILPVSKYLKITNSRPLSFCEGDSVILTSEIYENSTYQWYLNDQKIENSNTNHITTKKSGKYSLTITFQSCVFYSDTLNVINNQLTLFGASENGCVNQELAFYTEKNKMNYEWIIPNQIKDIDYRIVSGGLDSSSTLILKWLTPGNKEVAVKYDNGICKSPLPKTISMTIYDTIKPVSITGDSILNLCQNDSIKLSLSTTNSNFIQWYRNNEKLMDTDSVYFARVPGNYFAQLTNQGNCMFNTTSVNVTQDNCAKLNDYSFENKIIVFPNPTKELLTISGKVNEKLRIELINSLGQIVLNSLINEEPISVKQLPRGIYTLHISNENKQLMHREKVILD